jgi:hypothetical protein
MPITGVPITNFSPASIAGLQLWLDAADATTQTFSNTSIISWRDKSSNAYNFNQIAGSPSNYTSQFPVIGTSINSLGTIYFNQGASLKQNTIIDGVKNLFWVGRIDNLPGIYFLFGADSSYDWHADGYPLKFVNAYAQSSILSASPTSLYTNDSSAITNTAFSNVYYPSTTNTSILSVAGISGSTRFQGICYDRSGVHIGWCGDLAEVITFSTALTTSQIQQVEGYLAQKWGQTNNLPSSHPSLTQKLFTKPLAPMTLTPYYTAFTPLSIPGCMVWLDATTLSGTSITSWPDRSGNGNNASGSGTLNATAMNGQKGVYNTSVNITGNLPLSQNFTFFFVFTVAGPGGYPRIFYTGPGADNGPGNFMFELDNRGNNLYGYSSGPSFGYGNYSVTYGKTMMLSMQANSSSNIVKINSGSYATASVTSPFTFSNYNFGYGYVGEMLYYNTTLSSSNIQNLESYLSSKWGLVSSLPSSHLHFTQPAGLPTSVLSIVKTVSVASLANAVGVTVKSYLPMMINSTDIGGTPQTVTTNGSVTYKTIAGRQCAYFSNSLGNYLSFPYIAQTQVTLCFWLYTIDSTYYTAVSINDGNLNPTLQVDLAPSAVYCLTAMPSQWTNQPSGNYGGPGQWAHFAITINYSTYVEQLYINGTLISTVTGSGSPSIPQSQIWLGRSGDNYRAFYGYLCHFCYFPQILTQAQIQVVKTYTGTVPFEPVRVLSGIKPTGLQIYSVYNGGSRGGNYTISYSDDNTTFTTAFSGNVSSSACGIIAGSGTGDGSYGYHHYWKFVMTAATNLHFPRSSRIDLLAGNTVYNLITFESDNCSDTGKIPGLDYATTITNSYF